jgi:hypothetical protein
MSDDEIVQALSGVDSSDQWLAIENADDETKARARALWDVETGQPRDGGGGSYEDEGAEGEEEQQIPLPDGEYTFTRGDGNVLFIYAPGDTDPSDFRAEVETEESGRTFDTGTIELRDNTWQRPVVTGNMEDEAAEVEEEQDGGGEVPPAPPPPPVAGESESAESESEQEPDR